MMLLSDAASKSTRLCSLIGRHLPNRNCRGLVQWNKCALSRSVCSICSHYNVRSHVRTGPPHRTGVPWHSCRAIGQLTITPSSGGYVHSCGLIPSKHLAILSTTTTYASPSKDLTTRSCSLQCKANFLHTKAKLGNKNPNYTTSPAPCHDTKPTAHQCINSANRPQCYQRMDHMNKHDSTWTHQFPFGANSHSLFQRVCLMSNRKVSSSVSHTPLLRYHRGVTGNLTTADHNGVTSCNRYYNTRVGQEDPADPNSQAFCDYLAHLVREYETVSKVGGMKERELELRYVVDRIKALEEKKDELKEVEKLLQGGDSKEDKEMQKLAEEEIYICKETIEELQDEIVSLLTPPEEIDEHDILLELSAGVGGQEAMLFTGDMFNMYEKYAAYKGWRFRVIEYNTTDIGGVRSAVVSISGHQVNRFMKYEGGVHRVQRVPKTEKSGRMHTSTMTIAILPQPKKIEIKIDKRDLRIDTFKSSGAGGQHVNTTDSAVRIVHIPTGTTVECQQERSQIRNRQLAMEVLQVRLYNLTLQRHIKTERSVRKEQVGMAERSDKIRTYNFRDNRITDHRAGITAHQLDDFMEGGEELDDMVEKLIEMDQLDRLRGLIEEYRESKSGMASR